MDNLSAMPAHMPEYRARCVTLHRPIKWQQEGVCHSGYALDVDDDPRAAYFEQVQNGVYVRMALIMTLLGLADPKAPKEEN